MEGERFETASIAGKRLVLINDSERYAGSVSTLKALTAQDTLPYEFKYKQSTGGFTPTAMVIVAANETIQSSDYTSGLERRRITVPMLKKIAAENQRNLIEHLNSEITGDFASYIPGLLNWVLAIDEGEATNIIKNYHKLIPSLAAMKAQTLVESNPIADWLDSCIVYGPGYHTNVGVAKPDKDRDHDGSYFKGLKIQEESDAEPPLITGSCHKTLPNVMETVMDVTDTVMDESIASDECDGCYGIFKTCSEILNPEQSACNDPNDRSDRNVTNRSLFS